uniref:Uncharacterized protein n=1 Tax=Timema bartmani TaxID=61472 RepID=A0A7R9EXA2_9NEOP|nr:unnamed protein product [Timema bartmani]
MYPHQSRCQHRFDPSPLMDLGSLVPRFSCHNRWSLKSLRNMFSSYDENSQALNALEQGTALEGPLLFSLLLRKLNDDTRHRLETSHGTNCHRTIEKPLFIFGHQNNHCSTFSRSSGHLTDNFSYRMRVTGDAHKHTKRNILSIVAQIYDPCGWLAPVMFWAKMKLYHGKTVNQYSDVLGFDHHAFTNCSTSMAEEQAWQFQHTSNLLTSTSKKDPRYLARSRATTRATTITPLADFRSNPFPFASKLPPPALLAFPLLTLPYLLVWEKFIAWLSSKKETLLQHLVKKPPIMTTLPVEYSSPVILDTFSPELRDDTNEESEEEYRERKKIAKQGINRYKNGQKKWNGTWKEVKRCYIVRMDVGGKSKGRCDKEPAWLSNHLHTGIWEELLQCQVDHIRNLKRNSDSSAENWWILTARADMKTYTHNFETKEMGHTDQVRCFSSNITAKLGTKRKLRNFGITAETNN